MIWIVGIFTALIAATPADQEAVRAARTAQNEAIAAGDLDRAASFWTEDVTVRRALGQPLSGRDAARPLAFETGVWQGHQGSPAGPVVIGGRYSAQWVKRGDRWLIRSEVFVALTCRGAGCEATAVP